MHRVLISAPYMVRQREHVASILGPLPIEFHWADVAERLSAEQLLRALSGMDGIICGDDQFSEEVYAAHPQLQVVVKWGTGIDSIRVDLADKYGVAVKRTPGAFSEPVADSALAYMLAFCRGVVSNDAILKAGGWAKPSGSMLAEHTVGIVGLGDIGKAVARRLAPFRPTVLAYDPDPTAQLPQVESVSWSTLLARSTIVTIHCDLNRSSTHLFDADAFAAMEQKPIVINLARGQVMDEAALITALEAGQIRGAALDVFEHEPLAVTSPLRSHPNVLLAAHNSNSSQLCWDRVHRNSAAMLCAALGIAQPRSAPELAPPL